MKDIKKAEKQFAILDHSPIGQFVLRKDFVVIFWNRCLEAWSGISRDQIAGTNLITHFPHLGSEKYVNRIKSMFGYGPPIVFSSQLHKYFIPSPLPEGKFRIQSTFITSIPAKEKGEFYALFAIQDETNLTAALESNKLALKRLTSEIEVRRQVEEQLVKLARYDHLTGLANRMLFREVLLMAIAKIQRNEQSLAMMFLDLDNFKDINDTLGHDAGDLLLKSIAERLKSRVRGNDLVARVGGDEFAIFLDDCKSDDAAHVAQSILDILEPMHKLGDNEVVMSTSIGIAMCPDSGEDPESLYKSADIAMYYAKKMGRNNFQFFSPELNVQKINHVHIKGDHERAFK
ncbi:MAG: sensory response regulator with diguanylate cyclase domain protein [Candidatus Scalindua rubra]|uniref:Sensory response regulator with diguanylate cyclase domain protein n=1 Tax=Candidatus Scalindua rubra TaxID=1872076 RepID=A0A1E3X7A3_9BACT|nr:MAG: sensory response regulator with diguanylate cyclase domain protein [Candidatus Scalindua rubra]